MDNSAYAKIVLRSNRTIALAADKGIIAFQREFKKSVAQMSSGAERLTWYSACFFDKYEEECRELKQEDIRMGICIYEFFTRKDPVADLILMCLRYVLNFYDKKERINILARVYDVYEAYKVSNGGSDDLMNHEKHPYDINDCDDFLKIPSDSPENRLLLEGVANICNLSLWDLMEEPLLNTDGIFNPAKITTDIVARKTVAYAFAKAAAESVALTLTIREKLNRNGARIATVFFYYGLVQEASIAVRKLKMLNPVYYQILYNNKLEMFFFLIEPYLPPEVYHPSMFINNPDVVVSFLKRFLK